MQLGPGTVLQMGVEGERIILRPIPPKATLTKELGIWVHQGEPSDDSIPDLIDRVREERIRKIL
jgi:hypothetical protein